MVDDPIAEAADRRVLRGHHDHYSQYNYTITSSVSIRVTPLHDHLISWGILWGCFVVASAFGTFQAVRENRIMASRRTQVDDGDQVAGGDAESVSTADITRSIVGEPERVISVSFLGRLFIFLNASLLRSSTVSAFALISHDCSRRSHACTDMGRPHVVAGK